MGATKLYFGMTCCIALAAVIVSLLVTLLGVVIYVVVTSRKCRRHSRRADITSRASKRRENLSLKNFAEAGSSCTDSVCPQASAGRRTFGAEVGGSHSQDIPMTTFGRRLRTHDGVESSVSSAGLYDVLFPERHEGEISYDPPSKSAKFSRRAAAAASSGKSSQDDSRDTKAGASASGLNPDNATAESLDWDYYQQNLSVHELDAQSSPSEVESEVEPRKIRTVCWV